MNLPSVCLLSVFAPSALYVPLRSVHSFAAPRSVFVSQDAISYEIRKAAFQQQKHLCYLRQPYEGLILSVMIHRMKALLCLILISFSSEIIQTNCFHRWKRTTTRRQRQILFHFIKYLFMKLPLQNFLYSSSDPCMDPDGTA